MEKIKHSDMVAQLAKSGVDIVLQLTPNSAHLWHMATGIAGEAGELLEAVMDCESVNADVNVENILEELGDSEFYLEGFRQGLGFKRKDTLSSKASLGKYTSIQSAQLDCARLSMHANKLLDEAKKMAIYVKPINTKACMADLIAIEIQLDCIRQQFSITHKECLDHNVAKLGDRYQGHNYSNEQARDRADKNEAT